MKTKESKAKTYSALTNKSRKVLKYLDKAPKSSAANKYD